MKTKVRRLYDIANILQSLHLLEKMQLADSRKPAFRWLGIENRIARASPHTLKQFYRCRTVSAPEPQVLLIDMPCCAQSIACNIQCPSRRLCYLASDLRSTSAPHGPLCGQHCALVLGISCA